MKKILFAFWLTLLVSLNAHSQIWQSYRGIWLKGYDNATQAPIPPTGYSALTYFADSLGTYVYDWDSLAWLRIPGAGGGGGGGGGLVTADNGLNVNTPGNVRLGGPLSTYTTVSGGLFKIGDPSSQAWLFSNSSWAGDRAFGIWAGDTLQALVDTLSALPSMKLVHHANSGTSNLYMGDGITQALRLTVVPFVKSSIELGLGSIGNYSSISTNSLTGGLTMASDNDVRLVSRPWSPTLLTELKLDNNNAVLSSSSGSQINFNVASPTNAIISTANQLTFNAGSTSGNLSKATFTPTSLQLAVTDNFSFSNTFDLNPTSWNINIPSANFSANPSTTIWAQGSGGQSTSIELTHATESATLRSTTGSALKFDVSSAGGADVNSSGSLDLSTPTVRVELQSGVDRVVMRNPGTSTSFIRFDILNNDPEIMLAGSTQSQVSAIAGNTFVVKTRNYAEGANNSGDLHLHTGDVLAGKAGDISIKTGAVSSGTNGNIILDARAGFIIINPVSLPTTNPCGSAPSGTVWSDSGTLKICP